jgi:poly(hydroxyalkanoate) depolymerase family esterase
MNAVPNADAMREATRLTREGRLNEAMAVLQGAFTGNPASHQSSGAPSESRTAQNAEARILDMIPPSAESGGVWTASPERQTRPAFDDFANLRQSPDMLHGLLERLRGIGRGPSALRRAPDSRPQLRIAEGARFDQHSFSNAAGARAYKLYVPSGYSGQSMPLIVMLHGCTQCPDDFAAGTKMNDLAEEQQFLVAYPAQAQSANPSKCWNWFSPGHQERDQGEPSLIAGITRQVMADFSVETDRVFIGGLSAGGAAAAIMGETYPDLYAGIGVHSGLACGAAKDVPSAFGAMRQGSSAGPLRANRRDASKRRNRIIVFHGDQDATVNPVNADEVIARSKARQNLQANRVRGESTDGVAYTRTIHVNDSGRAMLEQWVVHGAGHAWSGGSPDGTYTDPRGPDASREMLRFFLDRG